MPANLENSAAATGLEKYVFIPIPKKGSAKECSNYCTTALISHASRVMFNFLQARLKQYVNCELPDVQAGFRKGRGTRDQIANIHWIIEKSKRVPEKHLFLLYWLCQSLWLCGSQQTGKFWKRWEYQTTWPASWEICMQVRKQQLELDMEQQTCSKSGKEYIKVVYCHPVYLTYMQSTSWEILGWRKHKLESRLPGEISITLDMKMTPPYGRKWKRTKEPLDESERVEKVGLKLNIEKTKIMTSDPITSWQIDKETMERVTDFILGGSKITADGDCSHEIKRCLLLGRWIMTNVDSMLKIETLLYQQRSHLVKVMVFPVVMYGCESRTIKKAEHKELMLLNCGVGENSWESLGLQGDPTSPS